MAVYLRILFRTLRALTLGVREILSLALVLVTIILAYLALSADGQKYLKENLPQPIASRLPVIEPREKLAEPQAPPATPSTGKELASAPPQVPQEPARPINSPVAPEASAPVAAPLPEPEQRITREVSSGVARQICDVPGVVFQAWVGQQQATLVLGDSQRRVMKHGDPPYPMTDACSLRFIGVDQLAGTAQIRFEEIRNPTPPSKPARSPETRDASFR